jgi:hypothetical protein
MPAVRDLDDRWGEVGGSAGGVHRSTGLPPRNVHLPGGTSMATKKKTTSKKGKIRDLSKSKKKLNSDQAKAVKGGAGTSLLEYSYKPTSN